MCSRLTRALCCSLAIWVSSRWSHSSCCSWCFCSCCSLTRFSSCYWTISSCSGDRSCCRRFGSCSCGGSCCFSCCSWLLCSSCSLLSSLSSCSSGWWSYFSSIACRTPITNHESRGVKCSSSGSCICISTFVALADRTFYIPSLKVSFFNEILLSFLIYLALQALLFILS